ncbi:MAG TPA: ABC transporter permease, partial [Brevibacillus sp.]|nr:ABC transporter permease [Brevibacillus sp.]
ELKVICKHALKNAIIPIVTYLGPLVAILLTGSFVIERIFSIPGIGRDFVTGISDRDYSVILGMTVFFGAFIVVANIIVDVLYAVIDRRVKMDE